MVIQPQKTQGECCEPPPLNTDGVQQALNLNISEFGDLHIAWSALSKQEEPFLCHGDLSHAVAGLDGAGQLIHALVGVQMIYDAGRQVHVLCLCFSLLPKGVEVSEHFWVDLLQLT